MHLLASETVTLDETAEAVDLAMPARELLFLSFTDSDLASVAAAGRAAPDAADLAVVPLAKLKHPMSVDLFAEKTAAGARLIVARVLGGRDAWGYGVDELARLARQRDIALALVPGCTMADPRLDAASTLAGDDLTRIWHWFQAGGAANMASFIGWCGARLGRATDWRAPVALAPAGRIAAACRAGEAGRALLLAYRAQVTAGDIAPLEALADALAARGLAVDAAYVSSLKDAAATADLYRLLAATPPDIILNTTSFSARREDGTTALDCHDAPVLQAVQSIGRRPAWAASTRGLSATDLAMNIVLPEVDGRIPARAISFKDEDPADPGRTHHRPDAEGIAFTADLAAGWVRLRHLPNRDKRLALVLPDYPGRAGRGGRAVGLDTGASAEAILAGLAEAGYDVAPRPPGAGLLAMLEGRAAGASGGMALADYTARFASLPEAFRASVMARWGGPEADPAVTDGAFRFAAIEAGHVTVALQPDRGLSDDRAGLYHDTNVPPCHAYIAFHLWLRHAKRIDALIHLGTHGTLEWLPGKAVALSAACAPAVLVGPVPVIYPFIVNNPGEAAHARRRLAAITLGHMTPPLTAAGHHGASAEIETLMDEYAAARALDPRRARLVGRSILTRAAETGLAAEAGIGTATPEAEALGLLDGWLCDLKEMRIGDGLHVLGSPSRHADLPVPDEACGGGELPALLRALSGRFIPAGPAGAPTPARRDVLPTGRNLAALDPRAIPTATAYALGRELARDLMTRHAQDHGEYPRTLVIDLWGSSALRTGGEDLAEAFALIGVRPVWDAATARLTGFTVLPAAKLEFPRVDVTLRISGLFRDSFTDQITLFDRAVAAVAALDEPADFNPLAASARAGDDLIRVFGAAPGAYGVGLAASINADSWADAGDLGTAYLAASHHAYGAAREGDAAPAAFAARVRSADAFVHVEDLAGRDVLDYDVFAEHEGGFAAAAASLGNAPALYRADTSAPGAAKLRTLKEDVARAVRGRATNPTWLAGQMRHGHRGAAEIAESLDNLYALAVTSGAVRSDQFDLMFDATLGDAAIRAFLREANPRAARGMAETFRRAERRGVWINRRNATTAVLAEMLEAS